MSGALGPTGLPGQRGDGGVRGVTGPTGPDSTATPGYTTAIATGMLTMVTGEDVTIIATCPTGMFILGGGYRLHVDGNFVGVTVRASRPSADDANDWMITVREDTPTGRSIQVEAYCFGSLP